MKPRNKTERRVVELSATLPSLRPKDEERMGWEYKHYYHGKGLCYFLVLERCKEFQVIRYYYKTSRSLFEFMQVWMNKDFRVCLAKDRFMGVDNWKRMSPLSVKPWFNESYRYSYLGGVERIGWSGSIVRSVIPELRKCGLKKSCHNLTPVKLCFALLNNNRIETLFKLRQYLLVQYFYEYYKDMTDWQWQSIRVALRHGYHWDSQQEVRDWFDMLNDLHHIGLDTHSPHYICPKYLNEAHQHWNDVRRRFDEGVRIKEIEKAVRAYEPTFKANREQFFGMVFKDKNLEIRIIPTAMGIREEGIAMHHCVGGYYNHPESLILSARINGKRIETIEVNLNDYSLVQSRGLCNKSTKYHKRIVKLVEANMDEIIKRNTHLKKAV